MLSINFVSQPITNCFSCKPSQQEALSVCSSKDKSPGPSTMTLLTVAESSHIYAAAKISLPIRVHRSTITGRQNSHGSKRTKTNKVLARKLGRVKIYT